MESPVKSSFILGAFICAGLAIMGYLLGSSAIRFKEYERFVAVKGLSEREVPADIAVWPINFSGANSALTALYTQLQTDSQQIVDFLIARGFSRDEVTVAAPNITDKLAQQYGGNENVQLRYTANQTITVYSNKIDLVRKTQNDLAELGKKGIAFAGGDYQHRTEYLYTKLNDIKPGMIEEATRKAREVAEKFAADSDSRLGKIRSANQGQFSINDRDSNTPYIKNVRVVATVEYYLSD
ncbi:MAG: SIMPL domain-containing protein [Steroidobacteraceae bacterium]